MKPLGVARWLLAAQQPQAVNSQEGKLGLTSPWRQGQRIGGVKTGRILMLVGAGYLEGELTGTKSLPKLR